MPVETRQSVEPQIRKLADDWANAVRAKNIDALMSHYAPEVVVFNIAPPLQDTGAEVNRRSWQGWFDSFSGPIGYEIRDLNIVASDDVGFCHSLNHITGTRKDGGRADSWVRVTACLRRIGSKWLVTHEHVSMPFDMKTGKAMTDLKP
jgi:ketosteroid isomerase-like protein